MTAAMNVVATILKDKLCNGEEIAVLFDLEQTLFISETIQEESFKSLAWILADLKESEKSLKAGRKAAEKIVADARIKLEKAGKLAFPSDVRDELGLTPEDQKIGKERYYVPEDHIQPYPWLRGDLAALKTARPAVKTAVITNQTNRIAERILNHIDVYDLMNEVFTQERMGLKKPNPLILARAARILGVPVKSCVSVGDSPEKDVNPALAIGMYAILVKGPGDVCKLCRNLML